jgi:hypothetical protein
MQHGLPQLAVASRSAAEQDALNISGLLHSDLFQADQGWYHAILAENPTLNIPKSPRWFGDHAAALIALDQPLPTTADKIVRGGSHISNDRWMFLNGRAGEWANSQDAKVQSLIAQQQTDGSVLYDGKWSEGHFEKTSSGQCGILANQLLQIAWWTGNRKALQAGLVTLDYCQRFRTPRGAQVWECPLHAPDLMAAAHLAQAYSLAFRLTGQPKYQDQAVRWATSGIPFIYLWGDSWMPYSSIATLCATHRVAPLWIGRPVQWCGIVYANALLDLREIDQSLPWKQLAEGIYRSATIQQYTHGRAIGLLPDSIFPTSNRRFPLDINPATIVLLGKRLEQKAVELQCAVIDGQHVVSPWPILSSPEEVRFDCGSQNDFEIAINGQVRSVRFDSRLTRPLK